MGKVFNLKPNKESEYSSEYARRKQYYEEHREKRLAQMKEYRESHKEEISLKKKKWWHEHYVTKGRHGSIPVNRKKVRQYDLSTNELLGEYESITDAAEDNRINRLTITKAIKEKCGVCIRLGWKFELVENN